MTRAFWLLTGGGLLIALASAYLFSSKLEFFLATGWTTPALRTSVDVPPDISFHLLVTCGRTCVILGLGVGFACLLAAIAVRTGFNALGDLLTLGSSVPPLVWIPLSIANFGLKEEAFVTPAIGFTAAFLAPAIIGQFRTAPQATVDMLIVLGFSRGRIRWAVVAPHILVGLAPTVALTFSLLFGMSTVVEYLGGFNGLGRVLRTMTFSYEVGDLLAITVVATVALLIVQIVLRRVMVSAAGLL